MKIVAIGDIHGRSIWKDIIEKEKDADLFIFMGDYFDSRNGYSGNRQIANFKEILELKVNNPDKYKLLFGNHELHYLFGINETYSGYQAGYTHDIGEILTKAVNEELVQMCYVHNNYVFTHAGISKTWLKDSLEKPDIQISELEETLNDYLKYKPRVFCFTMGRHFHGSGDEVCQTPIWIRPRALRLDMMDNIICVVGHTPQDNIIIEDNLIMVDTLFPNAEYLIIENDIPRIGQIKLEDLW